MRAFIASAVLAVTILVAFVASYNCAYRQGLRHGAAGDVPMRTWVDDVPVSHRVDALLGRTDRQLSNIDPPFSWVGSANKGTVARLVTDKVTGEQVLVVNHGWQDDGVVKYRILRQVQTTVREYTGEGWVDDTTMHGVFWTTEERTVDELAPIPSS